MVKKLSDLVNPALNKCFLPLGKGFEQHIPAGISYSRHTALDDRDFHISSLQPFFFLP